MSGHNVSVLMNTYQENKLYFEQAVKSYVNQVGVSVHLIISTIEDDISIKYINELKKKLPNANIELCISTKKEHPGKGIKGIYYQLNKGVKLIKGDWFCYASSNDVAMPKKIITEIQYCIKNKKSICYSAYNKTNLILKNPKKVSFHSFSYLKLLKGNFISDCSLIKSSILKEFLPFNNSYYNCGFWDLWLRIYNKYGNIFIYNPNVSFLYRICNESTHIKRNKEKNKELIYARAKINMRNQLLKKYPFYKRVVISAPTLPSASGIYNLAETNGILVWVKKPYIIVKYGKDWKIIYGKKEVLNNKSKLKALWQYPVSSINHI
jgi:hypothetical protein